MLKRWRKWFWRKEGKKKMETKERIKHKRIKTEHGRKKYNILHIISTTTILINHNTKKTKQHRNNSTYNINHCQYDAASHNPS